MIARFHSINPACTLALLAVAVVAALPPSAFAVPRSFFGVAPQTALNSEDIDRMGRGKIGTLRIYVPWAAVDPTEGQGGYDWSGIDPIVRDATRNGVDVLPFLYGTPDWVARGLDGRKCSGSRCLFFAPSSKAALGAWQSFVGAAVGRYGRGGEFWEDTGAPPPPDPPPDPPPPCPLPVLPCSSLGRTALGAGAAERVAPCGCTTPRPIRAWQIWNEQNSASFYKPKPAPKAYAKLLGSAAKAIRARDRKADVILGGMAGLDGVPKAITARAYLAKLYQVRGVKQDFDGVAPHPYGAQLSGVKDEVEMFRSEMKKAGDAGAGLWITEIGWGSDEGGHPLNRGREGQAKRLGQAYRYFKAKRGKLNVKSVTWFSFEDSPVSICEWCGNSGLFEQGLVEKPSWRALTKLTGGS